jgi:hypothetical protein
MRTVLHKRKKLSNKKIPCQSGGFFCTKHLSTNDAPGDVPGDDDVNDDGDASDGVSDDPFPPWQNQSLLIALLQTIGTSS